MKLPFSNILATAALLGNVAKLVVAADFPTPSVDTVETRSSPISDSILTVEFLTTQNKPRTPDEQAFMQKCLLDSFHETHDSNSGVHLLDLEFIKEALSPATMGGGIGGGLRAAEVGRQFVYDLDLTEYFPMMRCTKYKNGRRWCPRGAAALEALMVEHELEDPEIYDTHLESSGHSHQYWEKDFCKRLKAGPFDIEASRCKISLKNIPVTMTETGIQAVTREIEGVHVKAAKESAAAIDTPVSVVVPTDGTDSGVILSAEFVTAHNSDRTSEEQAFARKCLIDSFQNAHDPAYGVDLVDLQFIKESLSPVDDGNALGAAAGSMFVYDLDLTEYFPMMRCTKYKNGRRWCPRQAAALEELIVESQINDVKADDAKLGTGMNPHKDWEKKWCKLLQKGPYECFSDAIQCKIQLTDGGAAAAFVENAEGDQAENKE